MKRKHLLLTTALSAAMILSAPAFANVDYSDLDDMSVEELEALQDEVSGRISAMKSDAASEAGLLRLENDGGVIQYAGFVMNTENFHGSSSDDYVEALVLKFDYTNKEDEEKQAQDDFGIKAYQNGVEINTASGWTSSDALPPEVDNFFNNVLKGGTITIGRAFIPEDDSPVTIIVNSYGDDNGSATMELDFRNTPEGDAAVPDAGEENTVDEDSAQDDTEGEAASEESASEDENTAPAADPEEVDALLQGMWTLDNSGQFNFDNGTFTLYTGSGNADGTYTIDTEENLIHASILSSDGKEVSINLPFECSDGQLTLYNNNNEALTKIEKPEGISAEDIEAQISQQPVRVLSTEVTDGNDSRFMVSNLGILLPHIINESDADIKDVTVNFVAWDSNNLPVKIQSTRYNVPASYTPTILLTEVNLVPNSKLNEDGSDAYSICPFDTTISAAKAKAIVAEYVTYDGTTWTNPLLEDWKTVYGGQKLEEPVIYTDNETIQKVQTALNEAGYDCGTPDGVAGSKTYEALNHYQEDNGLPVSNDITDKLLEAMGIQ